MVKGLLVVVATAVAAAVLLVGVRALGPDSASFAFLVVWAPMTWLGTVSRVVQPRLPKRYHRLRGFEQPPHLYEALGVRVVKRLLRRGPIAVFNPGLNGYPVLLQRYNRVLLHQRYPAGVSSWAGRRRT